jgi:2-methylcitrate dehydratase PrpD
VDEEINQMKESRAAKVTVKLKDGRELKRAVLHFKGTPANPLSPEELHSKVERLAGYVLSGKKVEALIEKVRNLEQLEDMGTLL